MEDVRIYDYEFNLLHIEHDIVSCNWTLYENAVGSFEMHYPLRSHLTQIVLSRRYLVAVQGDKQAIITGKQADTEGVLYGKTCNWILTRFCMAEQFNTDALYAESKIAAKDAQTVCKYIYSKTLSNISNFSFADSTETYKNVYLENKTVSSAYELIRDCLIQAGAGHRVIFDIPNKRWVFRAAKGKTLPVILSEANRNAHDTEYTDDMQNYFLGGWYEQKMEDMGEWDASVNSPMLVNNQADNYAKSYRVITAGTRFGLTFENGDYIVCTDKSGAWEKTKKADNFMVHLPADKTGIYAWETTLSGETEAEATKKLATYKIEKEITADTCDLVYGKDYRLGDVVKFRTEKGEYRAEEEKKITGVHLWYETGERGEQPIMEELDV